MIRVLVVEDSSVAAQLIVRILDSDPEIEIVGVSEDGLQALEDIERLKPDIVTMDVNMPRLDGFEATRRIMETRPLPIVIVSGSFDRSDDEKSFRAIDAGALIVVGKPRGPSNPEHDKDARELIRIVKAMSEVKVVRHIRPHKAESRPVAAASAAGSGIELIVIGASTGGPPVLKAILSTLPRDFPAPILIVQHMSMGFMEGFVRWIDSMTGFASKIAEAGERFLPARAYFAPDGFHMLAGRDGRIQLAREEPCVGLCPSASRLFLSAAEGFGSAAAGVLLTGMGEDGARELKLMRDSGALTVAQDEESCVVFGMPGAAIKLDAAAYILPPEGIVALLAKAVGAGGGSHGKA